jgi:hypothetical protein
VPGARGWRSLPAIVKGAPCLTRASDYAAGTGLMLDGPTRPVGALIGSDAASHVAAHGPALRAPLAPAVARTRHGRAACSRPRTGGSRCARGSWRCTPLPVELIRAQHERARCRESLCDVPGYRVAVQHSRSGVARAREQILGPGPHDARAKLLVQVYATPSVRRAAWGFCWSSFASVLRSRVVATACRDASNLARVLPRRERSTLGPSARLTR